ncbi:MAG TPA: hypothetical protein VGU65_13455 [Frateuria sp.]|nr:hypothetical protein [Frateuria sp.]
MDYAEITQVFFSPFLEVVGHALIDRALGFKENRYGRKRKKVSGTIRR